MENRKDIQKGDDGKGGFSRGGDGHGGFDRGDNGR